MARVPVSTSENLTSCRCVSCRVQLTPFTIDITYRKMEQHSQQDPPSTGGAPGGEMDETILWYARSGTCGTIIEVLSALEAPAKGGVGPQAAVEINEEAGMQIRVLEGAHSTSTRPARRH